MNIKEACFNLYCDEFGNDLFAKELFDSCFKYCKYYCVNGVPVSIMFLLPCKICLKNIEINAKYIFAVTTSKKYRNKGYMKKLFNNLDTEDVFFLKPANDTLINLYRKLGFKTFDGIKSRVGDKKAIPLKEFLPLAEKYKDLNSEVYTGMYYYKKSIDLNGLAFPFTME